MGDERIEEDLEVSRNSVRSEAYSPLIPELQGDQVDYPMDHYPPAHALRSPAEYPRMPVVTEDQEERPVDLKWDLLHPAFLVPFRRGTEKLLCIGLALSPYQSTGLLRPNQIPETLSSLQSSETLVLMSLEFFSLEKGEYLQEIKPFEPFEFTAMEGAVPRIKVIEEGAGRVLCLENKTHRFLFSLTETEGVWKCSPLE